MSEIAIVAALQREVEPLARSWQSRAREHSGRTFLFFESGNVVLVCGGVGAEAARRATEAIIALFRPTAVISAGFAGSLEEGLGVGEVLEPQRVIDAGDGSRVDTGRGAGTLVSVGSVAGTEQKVRLARAFSAQAVDMEAAAVAKGAQAHGVDFWACKVISDELGFAMPPVGEFVEADGSFRSAAFALHVTMHPRLWAGVARLARNSRKAARALCERLAEEIGEPARELTGVSGPGRRDP
jgi:adenosylhomocysteine nucleosidase